MQPMIKSYLVLNAVLYLGLVVWCSLRHEQTSRAGGFVSLDNSGHSEYLVIYGGLQLGIAAFYGYLAASPVLHRTGIVFSLMLYLPIVLYRIVTVIAYRPVSGITLGTGALELALLAGAAILFFRAA